MLRCVLRLKLYGCRRQSVPGDINKFERCFLGLFGLLHGVLGSVCALSSSLFMLGFVNSRIVEPISVSDAINFRLETVMIPGRFCSEVVVRSTCTLTTTSMLD